MVVGMIDEGKKHWETVFETKSENEVSWFENYPKTSIEIFKIFDLPKQSKIIDVGGGDSYFIDVLIEEGYTNLYLLDISEKAIDKVKARLGSKSKFVTFIVTNVLDFNTNIKFDFWHDRASFHFITNPVDINRYVELVSNSIVENGNMAIGTFSEDGPKKCSGLEIKQYNEKTLSIIFKDNFEKIDCWYKDHNTPFGTIQNFIYCTFKKNNL